LLHEWNEPWLVKAVAAYRRRNPAIRIFFHDTHHRAISDPNSLNLDNIAGYDAVLAYGASLREVYRQRDWADNVYVWHEAADTRVFRPLPPPAHPLDVAWIGNWGDEERAAELDQFLLRPSAALSLNGTAHGVRYPEPAILRMRDAGFTYQGWLANHRVPEVFAAHRVTVHVPRRPYITLLPGIPTIRPFEAMACGIPLIISQWRDTEGLFREGVDFLSAHSEAQMRGLLNDVLTDANLRESLRRNGLETISRRHNCAHRVDELLNIYLQIGPSKNLSAMKQAPLEAVAG
jgi:spore maturation protein CgeB